MTITTASVPSRRTVLLALIGIAIISAGLRYWMVTHTVVPSRDCLVFVRIAMQLNDPPKSRLEPARQLDGPADVLRETDQAPGYPLAILGLAKLRGLDLTLVTPDEMVRSAQLISALSGILLIFPMYGVSARVFGPTVAILACGWYQVLPVFVEVTSDGLSDGLFLWTAVTALWFGLRALDRETWKSGILHGILAGGFVGGGYLVRPDSLIVGAALGLMFAGTCIARVIRKERCRPLFLAGIGLMIGTISLMYPYVSIIGKLTNKPTGQGIIDGSGEEKKTYFDRNTELPGVRLPFAAWWDAKDDGNTNRMLWGAKALGSETLKGGHYLLPIIAIFGLWLSRRRWTEVSILLLLLLLALHMGVLWYMASRIGYVSQRHTLLSVMLGSIFAASALPSFAEWGSSRLRRGTPKFWISLWVLLIAGSCLPRDFQRLHADRTGHREAGEWIRTEGNIQFPVVDPYGWVEFYSGRTVKGWSTANPYKKPMVYSIVEPNAKSHHSRLPWLEAANKLAAGGELVFQFPQSVPIEQVKIAVYRCPPLKPGQ